MDRGSNNKYYVSNSIKMKSSQGAFNLDVNIAERVMASEIGGNKRTPFILLPNFNNTHIYSVIFHILMMKICKIRND